MHLLGLYKNLLKTLHAQETYQLGAFEGSDSVSVLGNWMQPDLLRYDKPQKPYQQAQWGQTLGL